MNLWIGLILNSNKSRMEVIQRIWQTVLTLIFKSLTLGKMMLSTGIPAYNFSRKRRCQRKSIGERKKMWSHQSKSRASVVHAGRSQQQVSLRGLMPSKLARELSYQNNSSLTVFMDQASKAINVKVDMSLKQ